MRGASKKREREISSNVRLKMVHEKERKHRVCEKVKEMVRRKRERHMKMENRMRESETKECEIKREKWLQESGNDIQKGINGREI